ncbi:MAG: hypothetical protein LR008_01375, partial [Candidatus Pacebacteria bacterium]|nr:hypothetical protein [Candidatus Paceibacterota bacterium]
SEDLLEQTEEDVEKAIRYVEVVRDNLVQQFEGSTNVNEVSSVIDEVGSYLNRVKELKEKIQDNKIVNEDISVLRNKLSVYRRIADEIKINVDVAEQVLLENHNLIQDSLKQKVSISEEEESLISEVNDNDTDSFGNTFRPSVARKEIVITADDEVSDMKIDVTDKVLRRLREDREQATSKKGLFSFLKFKRRNSIRSEVVAVSSEQVLKPESAALAAVENIDPINKVIHNNIPEIVGVEDVFENDTSRYMEYLTEDRYVDFVKDNFRSPTHFGRMVENQVVEIEAETLDLFDRYLGDNSSSFQYIENMSLSEVIDLSNSEGARDQLIAEGLKYETFVNWVDFINDLQVEQWADTDMKFGEFFTKWLIENALLEQH